MVQAPIAGNLSWDSDFRGPHSREGIQCYLVRHSGPGVGDPSDSRSPCGSGHDRGLHS